MIKRLAIAAFLLASTQAFAIDFPSSPSDAQQYTFGNHTWTYSTTNGGWGLTDNGVTYPLTVPDGGTGWQSEQEALGELTEPLTADTNPTPWTDFYAPFYNSSSDTGVKINLRDIDGLPLIASGRFDNVAQVDVPLSADYKNITINFHEVTNSADEPNYEIRVSQDGGSNFLAGASDYAWSSGYDCNFTTDNTGCGSGSDDNQDDSCFTFIFPAPTVGYPQSRTGLSVEFRNPQASAYPGFSGSFDYFNNNFIEYVRGGFDCQLSDTTSAAINYMRLLVSSGIINGTYAVYGTRR